jgi:putative heme-binding domain-containing protein
MALRNQLLLPGAYEGVAALPKDAVAKIANVSPGVRNEESAGFLLSWMKGAPLNAAYLRYVTRYVRTDALDGVFEQAKALDSRPPRERLTLLRALQQGCQERGMKLPAAFSEIARSVVAPALASEDKAVVTDALKLCREIRLEGAYEDVEKLAIRGKGQDLRTAAFDALAALNGAKAVATLAAVAANPAETMTIRQKAAASLGGVNNGESRAELVKLLQSAPQPLGVQIAIGLSGSKEGAALLLGAVEEGKASPRLLADKAVEGRVRATKEGGLIERMEKRVKDLPPEDQRIQDLIKARQKGYFAAKPNATHGAEVFAKTCAGCHKIDGKGQKIGPELDAVYTRGVERLLEDILDPNRNVDQAFRATIIKMTDGRVISGLVLREEGEVLVIQEAADKETRLAKKEIEKRVLSELSPMPTNVLDPLSEADFYDLLAYLLQPRGQK